MQYVHEPTAKSFKMYIFEENGHLKASGASSQGWKVNWIGVGRDDARAGIQQDTFTWHYHSMSWSDDVRAGPKPAFASPFTRTPTFLLSAVPKWVQTAPMHGNINGTAAAAAGGAKAGKELPGGAIVLHDPTQAGFTAYATPQFCTQQIWQSNFKCKIQLHSDAWRVVYLGHQPVRRWW